MPDSKRFLGITVMTPYIQNEGISFPNPFLPQSAVISRTIQHTSYLVGQRFRAERLL